MNLVTGATGNVGRELVNQLVKAQQPVRALTRDPAKAHLPVPVQVCAADLEDANSLPAVLKGVEAAFLLVHIPGDPGQARNFLQAAKQAGLKRVVVLSSLSVEALIPGDPIGDGHRELERAVTESGLSASFLRPGTFMSNSLLWADQVRSQDVIRGMAVSAAAPIDPFDVATVAALALTNPSVAGRVYALTGPEPLSSADQVRILGEVLHRSLRFEPLPPGVVREWIQGSLGGHGDPDALIESVSGPNVPWATPRSTVFDVTGRAPRTFRAWAEAHIDTFR